MISLDDASREIKASKKHRVLSLDTIRHVLAQETAKHDSLKNVKKSAPTRIRKPLRDKIRVSPEKRIKPERQAIFIFSIFAKKKRIYLNK